MTNPNYVLGHQDHALSVGGNLRQRTMIGNFAKQKTWMCLISYIHTGHIFDNWPEITPSHYYS